MSSPSGIKSASETSTYPDRASSLSDASTAAYRESFDDEDEESSVYSSTERAPKPTFVSRLLRAMTSRRRKPESDYFSTPRDELPDGLLKKRRSTRHASPRESRKCRRSYVGGCIKRTLLWFPVLVLIAFGILHVAQFLLGRANPFWDLDDYDEFLPDWGKPGAPGEGLAEYPTDATRDVIPIPCHSHNDYWRRVPLFDAIHWGCTGVEADVWLFDEELYVGHNTAALTKNRTFRNLYVNPLVELLDAMNPATEFANATGHGVFDADPDKSLVLLIDFKTNGRDTFPFVQNQLSALREKNYLTYWDGQKLHPRAVTVVGTGNTPFDLILQNTTYRDIFFDAPLDRLYETSEGASEASNTDALKSSAQGTVGTSHASLSDFTPETSYYASVSFTHAVGFVWRGRLSPKQMDIIRGQIRGAHRRGLKVRYWDTPSWPVSLRNHVWHVLMKEGADMLNVDDLKAAAVENWKARVHGFW